MAQILYSLASWSNFYSGKEVNPIVHDYIYFGQYSNEIVNDFYINNVVFTGFGGQITNGGAIDIDLPETETRILIESSSFIHCRSMAFGGSIRSSTNGQCALNKICSSDSVSGMSNFCFIQVKNSVESKNFIEQSSIADVDSSGSWNAHFKCGNVKASCNNISNIKCESWSGISLSASNFENEVTTIVSYSTFENNIADPNYIIIALFSASNKKMDYCNVIKNTCMNNEHGLIYLSQTLTISNTCIKENTADLMFSTSTTNVLLTLDNCTIDNKSCGNIQLQKEITPKAEFVNALAYNPCFLNINLNKKKICPTLIITKNFYFAFLETLVFILI